MPATRSGRSSYFKLHEYDFAGSLTCPRVIKRGRHNFYRVKKPGDKNVRHDGPATIRLANPVLTSTAA